LPTNTIPTRQSPIGVYIDDVYIAAAYEPRHGLVRTSTRGSAARAPGHVVRTQHNGWGYQLQLLKSPSLSGANGYARPGTATLIPLRAQGAIEETLVDGQLGLRLAANYVKGNGQIENIYPGGEDPNSQDSRQVRLSVRFKPGDGPLDVKIRAYAGRDNPTQAAVHGIVPYRQGLDFFQVNEKQDWRKSNVSLRSRGRRIACVDAGSHLDVNFLI